MGATGKATSSSPYRFGIWDYEDSGMNGEVVQETIKWFRSNTNLTKWEKNVTQEELQALEAYIGAAYYQVNQDLIKGNALSPLAQQFVDNVDSAISKFDVYNPMVVARTDNGRLLGLNPNHSIRDLQKLVGKTVTSNGYVSTNSDQFGSLVMGGNVQYNITIPAGKGIGAWLPTTVGALNKGESEFLIGRGHTFKVVSVYKDRFGENHVNLELVK